MDERYESLRNGQIGILVERTEDGVVLDFDGNQKLIKQGNLKRWYKPCVLHENDVKKAKKDNESIRKIDKIIESTQPTNEVIEADYYQPCDKLLAKLLNYAKSKNVVAEKVGSYTKLRIMGKKRNIAELWYGKQMKCIRMVVRSEAIIKNKTLHDMGKLAKPEWFYSLDLAYTFRYNTDEKIVYDVLDYAIDYEMNYKPTMIKGNRADCKNGSGRVNGKSTLNYKRKLHGIKDDLEKQQEQLDKSIQELDKQIDSKVNELAVVLTDET